MASGFSGWLASLFAAKFCAPQPSRRPALVEAIETRTLLSGLHAAPILDAPAAPTTTAVAITLHLQHDTGTSNTDRLTNDPSITGSVLNIVSGTTLRGWFDGASASTAFNVSSLISTPSKFTLTSAQLATINRHPLADGAHTFHLQAVEPNSQKFSGQLTFTLDRTVPKLTLTAPVKGAVVSFDSLISGSVSDHSGVTSLGYRFTAGGAFTIPVRAAFSSKVNLLGVKNGSQNLIVTASDAAGNAASVSVAVQVKLTRLYGLDFGPYVNTGESPATTTLTRAQLTSRIGNIAEYANWVRVYSASGSLAHAGAIIHSFGLKAAVGAILTTDPVQNQKQINDLIAAAKSGEVDLAIVGNEPILQGLSAQQIIGYIQQVRAAIPRSIPVTTADTYYDLLQNPQIIANCDLLFPNIFPYFEGRSIQDALVWLPTLYSELVAAAGGKQVVVSESGWPSAGPVDQKAVPSPANAAMWFNGFESFVQTNHINSFYFEAADEPFKAAVEGAQGAHWGFFTSSFTLKSGMSGVFHGQINNALWQGNLVGGKGTRAVHITTVPPIGTSTLLSGQALHVNPGLWKIALYDVVNNQFWIKPSLALPATALDANGNFSVQTVSGGSDAFASEYRIYLLPWNFSIPLVTGANTLPPILSPYLVADIHR